MSKERLEEIKIWVANFVGNEDTDYPTLRLDDYEWLIQQAEKVPELEDKVTYYKEFADKFLESANKKDEIIEKIERENQRYKEALEEIKETIEDSAETPELLEIWDITEEILEGEPIMEIYKKLREWLLNADYPVHMVAMMTDEDVVAEYEAVTGDNSVPQPVN